MLLWLSEYLIQYYSGFNVFLYITLRTILGALTSLFIALAIGPILIAYLSKYKVEQTVRDDGPESHLLKTGTPHDGGGVNYHFHRIQYFMLGQILQIGMCKLYVL